MSERVDASRSALRIPLVSMGFVALGVAVALIVQVLPAGWFGAFVAGLLGLLVTPVLASPLEWAVHSRIYHRDAGPLLRRIHAVHRAHHHLYFPTWRYVTGGPPARLSVLATRLTQPCRSFWGNAVTRAAHYLFYLVGGALLLWLPAWLLSGSVPFLVGIVLASLVLCNLFITVHDAIHRPHSHRLLQAQPWFRFLDEHHYIHHVDHAANVNFLLPLADWLFGTLRRSLTREELAAHGSREAAKRHPIGFGEPARRPARAERAPTLGDPELATGRAG